MNHPLNNSTSVVYYRPANCCKCTHYGNVYVSPNRCSECIRNCELPVKVIKLGRLFSKVIFDRELVQKIVLTSRLRTTADKSRV